MRARPDHLPALTLLIALLAAMFLVACGDGTTDPPPDLPRPTTITVTPATADLAALGATVQLSAQVQDQNGQTMAGATVTWASSAVAVATASASGLVTAAANGRATITATAGEASGNAAVTVRQMVSTVDLDLDSATVVTGDTLRLSAAATDANGHAVAGAAIEWSSSAPQVATVDASGLMRGVSKGVAVIAATSGTAADSAAVRVVAALSVSFAEESLRVAEGETATVGIRYRVRELAAPVTIEVSRLEGDAEAEDYELSESRFEIPAGSGVEGTFEFTVAARADAGFAEGEEGITLELSVPDAIEAEVGGALSVAVPDAPVAACVGVTLAATPPEPVRKPGGLRSLLQGRDRISTSLTSEWHPSAREVTMRWAGPYGEEWEWFDVTHHPYYREQAKPFPVQPDFHIEAWRFEPGASSTRHVMEISWSAEADLELMFRCGTGDVAAVCDSEGCKIREMAESLSASGRFERASLPGARGGEGRDGGIQAARALIPDGNATGTQSLSASRGAYNFGAYNFLGAGWHPSAWGPGDTLVFHLSSENWPEDAGITPVEAKKVLERMMAEWSAIPTADIAWRVEGPVSGLLPGRDGKNIFWIDPEYEHGGGVATRWYDSHGDEWKIVELDHRIAPRSVRRTQRDYDDSAWLYIAEEMGMHPLGHTLDLDHAGTFPVFASCPEQTMSDCAGVSGNLDYWREVSGAWQLDPIMSYGASGTLSFIDERRSVLRLDDKVGASLLRPKPGWLETTGSIAGSVRTDDGSPVPHIHVWAVRPDESGRMDGVGSFADRNGDFRIRGLPPGEWILIAHPDLSWVANPWLFFEGQGELTDEMLLFPVRTRAGQTTGGIDITMSRGRKTTAGAGR